MKKILLSCFIFAFASTSLVFAEAEEKKKQMPSLTAGVGLITFDGDVGSGVNLSSFGRIRGGYNFRVEQRLGDLIGFSLTGIYGKIADSESGQTSRSNFESPVLCWGE